MLTGKHFVRSLFLTVKRRMPPPERWDIYCPMGKVIPGTKFVAFKVPLKEELMQNVKEEDRFSPAILMKHFSDQGQKLGGIIDLTFTLKYYNKEVFTNESIGHKKIFVKGHEIPTKNVFQEFVEAVRNFGQDDHLIGVHCTHGVNRTGYLICRYMIEELNMEPEEAITLFNEARGHEIERINYLEDLRCMKKDESSYQQSSGHLSHQNCESSESQNKLRHKERHRRQQQDFNEARDSGRHSNFAQHDGRGRGYSNSWGPPHGAYQTDVRNNPWEDRRSYYNPERFDRGHRYESTPQQTGHHRGRYNHSFNEGNSSRQRDEGRIKRRGYDGPGRDERFGGRGGWGRGRGRGWRNEQNYGSGEYDERVQDWGSTREGYEMWGRREGLRNQNKGDGWGRTSERQDHRRRGNEEWDTRAEGYEAYQRSREDVRDGSREGHKERRGDEGWGRVGEGHEGNSRNRDGGWGRTREGQKEQGRRYEGHRTTNRNREDVGDGTQEGKRGRDDR